MWTPSVADLGQEVGFIDSQAQVIVGNDANSIILVFIVFLYWETEIWTRYQVEEVEGED